MTNQEIIEKEKYDKAYNDFCEDKKITFPKTDLIDIWSAYIDDLWECGFEDIFGYDFHNSFLVKVLIPTVSKNKQWLLENEGSGEGENIVTTIHSYRDEIRNILK